MLMESQAKLYDDMKQWKDDVMGHLDVVAENIRHDLKGASRDELESLKDTTTKHEKRIEALEMRPV